MGKKGDVEVLPANRQSHKDAFLDALAEGDLVTVAARKSGACFKTLYNWKKEDPVFAAEWDVAYAQGTENKFVAEAVRRAVEGTCKPVFHQGFVVGGIQEYSDTLLLNLLAARDPGRFCPKLRAARILKAEQEEAERRAREAAIGESAFDPGIQSELDALAAAKTANTVH